MADPHPLTQIEDFPWVATRTGENEMTFKFIFDPWQPVSVTWAPCPQLGSHEGEPLWGLLVNGEFLYMENPFWLMDMFSDEDYPTSRIGGTFVREEEMRN